jgi:hypothetical protein
MTTNSNGVESLLIQAEQAHGQYEQTILITFHPSLMNLVLYLNPMKH